MAQDQDTGERRVMESSFLATGESRSSDHIGESPKGEEKNLFLRIATFWNIFDVSPDVQEPPEWRYAYGCVLTSVYLIGTFVIIGMYYITITKDGRPFQIDSKYSSSADVASGAMDEFICKCDFPAHIQGLEGNDTRAKTFNRCYDQEEPEVRSEVDVLQYRTTGEVNDLIEGINKNAKSVETFRDGYRLAWSSYELTTPADDAFEFNSPLKDLKQNLTSRGYVGGDGFITVGGLASTDNAFFAVPQGFIKAAVDFNCSTCINCSVIWNAYSSQEATKTYHSDLRSISDEGWVFCEETSESTTTECTGTCRFFRTYGRPWGIAMHNFAIELQTAIGNAAADGATIIFKSSIFYANVSEVTAPESYNTTFLEVERTGTVWAQLLNWYPRIPECGKQEESVVVCTGTSICGFAPTYSLDAHNSEYLNVECMNYPTQLDYNINRTQCEGMVSDLNLTTRVNPTIRESLCRDFECHSVQATQIVWSSFTGETALNRLIQDVSQSTTYVPTICTKNFTQVLVTYEPENRENKMEPLLHSVYEMNCVPSNSSTSHGGCWLTGHYTDFTDKRPRDNTWTRFRNFTLEEDEAGKKMFACYRFVQESFLLWLYNQWGIVSGTIGSWLLLFTLLFWIVTRPRFSKALTNFLSKLSSGAPESPKPSEIPMFVVEPR